MRPPTAAVADELRDQLLDAAEGVFYARGIQAVSMDELREASGLALRRIYQIYPAKDEIVVAVLRRRHRAMMANIAAEVGPATDAREAVIAVFDYLERWFAEPTFRGCPWMNAYGEWDRPVRPSRPRFIIIDSIPSGGNRTRSQSRLLVGRCACNLPACRGRRRRRRSAASSCARPRRPPRGRASSPIRRQRLTHRPYCPAARSDKRCPAAPSVSGEWPGESLAWEPGADQSKAKSQQLPEGIHPGELWRWRRDLNHPWLPGQRLETAIS